MTPHYRAVLAADPAIPSCLTHHIDRDTAEAYASGEISRRGVLVRLADRKIDHPAVRSALIEHAPWVVLWPLVRRSWSALLGMAVVVSGAVTVAAGTPVYTPRLPQVLPAWEQPIGQLWGRGEPHVASSVAVPASAAHTTVVVMASPSDTPQQTDFIAAMAPVAAWVAQRVDRPGVTVPFLLAQWGDESGWSLGGDWRGGRYGLNNFAGIESASGHLRNYASVWDFARDYARILTDGTYDAVLSASSLRAALAAMSASPWAQGHYDGGRSLASASRLVESVREVVTPP